MILQYCTPHMNKVRNSVSHAVYNVLHGGDPSNTIMIDRGL